MTRAGMHPCCSMLCCSVEVSYMTNTTPWPLLISQSAQPSQERASRQPSRMCQYPGQGPLLADVCTAPNSYCRVKKLLDGNTEHLGGGDWQVQSIVETSVDPWEEDSLPPPHRWGSRHKGEAICPNHIATARLHQCWH